VRKSNQDAKGEEPSPARLRPFLQTVHYKKGRFDQSLFCL
jgi:hypothetical protein